MLPPSTATVEDQDEPRKAMMTAQGNHRAESSITHNAQARLYHAWYTDALGRLPTVGSSSYSCM